MRHDSVRQLFEYWNRQRQHGRIPEREDIEPGAIRTALADTFLLAADPAPGFPYRLAGTRVCAIFGRELKGSSFTAQFAPDSRRSVLGLLAMMLAEPTGICACVTGDTAYGPLDLELLLLPLARRGGGSSRVLGALAPLAVPYWLGHTPAQHLELGAVSYLGRHQDHDPPEAAPACPSTRPPRFVVHQGARG